MFDAGFWEFLLVGIVALLVVGPERLPGLARKAGYWIGRARKFVNTVKADVEREFRTEELEKILGQQNKEIQELREMMKSTQQSTLDSLNETESLVRSAASMEPAQTNKNEQGKPLDSPTKSASEKSEKHG